jgi:hypothetical protein
MKEKLSFKETESTKDICITIKNPENIQTAEELKKQ